jgi:hypothetical protein
MSMTKMMLACALLALAAPAQVTFQPNGGNVTVGGTIIVTNNDASPGEITLRDKGGSVIWTGSVPPAGPGGPGKTEIQIPESPGLIGQEATLEACTDSGCYGPVEFHITGG